MALTASEFAAAIPGTPLTYEYAGDFLATPAQAASAAVQQAPGPAASSYLGWTVPVTSATSTAALTSTGIYVVAVYVPVGGTTTYLDVFSTTVGTVTVFDVGLFSLTGVQLAKALTANLTSNAGVWSAGLNTWTWITPAAVTGGSTYYVTIETTASGATSLAASPASPVVNLNLPANQYNNATYSTGTVPTSITLGSLSASVLAQPWAGIR